MTKSHYPIYQIVIVTVLCLSYIVLAKDFFFSVAIFLVFLLHQKDAYLMYDDEYLYKKKTFCPLWSKEKYNKYSLAEIKYYEDGVKNLIIRFEAETVVLDKRNMSSDDKRLLIKLLKKKCTEN